MWAVLGGAGPPRPKRAEFPPFLLRLTNLLGYLFLILVNVLSSIGAFGGTNAEVSGNYSTPLTPAGWAFAIWGLIFALQGLGVVYQVLNSGYREGGWKTSVVVRIGYGWQLGWLCQDLWQFIFVRQSVVGMYFAFACLAAALTAFQITLQRLNGTTQELRERGFPAMPVIAYVFYKLPTSINSAWLSVATALGLLIIPVAHGVAAASLVAPSALLAVVVTAGGVWRLLAHQDVAYGLTLVWALTAVAADSSGRVPRAVKVVGIVCVVLLVLLIVSALVRTKRELLSRDCSTSSLGGYSGSGSPGHSRGGGAVDSGFYGDGGGSLLHAAYNVNGGEESRTVYGTSGYGIPYGAQRIPLSDSSDALAGNGGGKGYARESGSGSSGGGTPPDVGSFTFPMAIGGSSVGAVRGALGGGGGGGGAGGPAAAPPGVGAGSGGGSRGGSGGGEGGGGILKTSSSTGALGAGVVGVGPGAVVLMMDGSGRQSPPAGGVQVRGGGGGGGHGGLSGGTSPLRMSPAGSGLLPDLALVASLGAGVPAVSPRSAAAAAAGPQQVSPRAGLVGVRRVRFSDEQGAGPVP